MTFTAQRVRTAIEDTSREFCRPDGEHCEKRWDVPAAAVALGVPVEDLETALECGTDDGGPDWRAVAKALTAIAAETTTEEHARV